MLELLEVLKVADVEDRIRSAAEIIGRALIETRTHPMIGADPPVPTSSRLAQRNGHRPRVLPTNAG